MSSIVVAGDTSGSITLQAPAVAGTNTLTLPALTGTVALNGPAFSAYQSVTNSYSAATWTKVAYQTKDFDTNSNYDNTTNYRFTPTIAGYYQVNFSINYGSVTGVGANERALALYKNGSAYFWSGDYSFGVGGTAFQQSGSSLVYLNGSTDYIEVYLYSSVAGTTNSASYSKFQAVMVRSA